ncbi:MAG: hypothetical protein AAF927_01725 [Bacteroidota bacterium]
MFTGNNYRLIEVKRLFEGGGDLGAIEFPKRSLHPLTYKEGRLMDGPMEFACRSSDEKQHDCIQIAEKMEKDWWVLRISVFKEGEWADVMEAFYIEI